MLWFPLFFLEWKVCVLFLRGRPPSARWNPSCKMCTSRKFLVVMLHRVSDQPGIHFGAGALLISLPCRAGQKRRTISLSWTRTVIRGTDLVELKRKTKAVTWKSPIKRSEWKRAKRWRENRAEWTTTIFSLRNSISRLFSADSQQYLISDCWTALYPDYMTVGPAAIYKVFIAFGSEIISLVSTWIVVCFQGNCRPSSARTGMVLPRLVFWAHHVLTRDVAKKNQNKQLVRKKAGVTFSMPCTKTSCLLMLMVDI